MASNLNKTKNPSQKKTFETSYKTRGTTQITENIFRHFPGSNKPFAFTQHYGRSLLGIAFRSSDSEGISHWKVSPLPRTNRQFSERFSFRPSSSQSFVIFKFESILTRYGTKVKCFTKFFLLHRKLLATVSGPHTTENTFSPSRSGGGMGSMQNTLL